MKIKLLSTDAKEPTRNGNAAGYDLYAAEDVIVPRGAKRKVRTDVSLELPEGLYAEIKGRSGITGKTGINVLTGTIDNDYRGNLIIAVQNTGNIIPDTLTDLEHKSVQGELDEHFKGGYLIRKGDRLAQLILHHQITPELEVVDELSETTRGDKGFGSSGTR